MTSLTELKQRLLTGPGDVPPRYSFAPPVCPSLAPTAFDSEEWSCRRKMLRTM